LIRAAELPGLFDRERHTKLALHSLKGDGFEGKKVLAGEARVRRIENGHPRHFRRVADKMDVVRRKSGKIFYLLDAYRTVQRLFGDSDGIERAKPRIRVDAVRKIDPECAACNRGLGDRPRSGGLPPGWTDNSAAGGAITGAVAPAAATRIGGEFYLFGSARKRNIGRSI
jgi:hypothetical protein